MARALLCMSKALTRRLKLAVIGVGVDVEVGVGVAVEVGVGVAVAEVLLPIVIPTLLMWNWVFW